MRRLLSLLWLMSCAISLSAQVTISGQIREKDSDKGVADVNIMLQYRKPVTHIEWKLTNQTREIYGYLCSSAEAMFGGRMWRVWFAPEVAISSGPWLLDGLPGMILSAEDSDGDFRFEMEGISQKNEEIRLYDWITKQITKKQWLKFEKNAHLNPYSQFSKGGQIRFYNSSDMRELKNEWIIEYYPLLK